MIDATTMTGTEQNFDRLLQSHDQAFALFYATWCPFCVRFLPVFEKTIQNNSENISFIMVNDQETLEDRYHIEVVPSVLFFQNGELSKRLDGKLGVGLSEKQLVDFIHSAITSVSPSINH